MSQKKRFKEVRQQMQEITKRKPTGKQLDDLKKALLEAQELKEQLKVANDIIIAVRKAIE